MRFTLPALFVSVLTLAAGPAFAADMPSRVLKPTAPVASKACKETSGLSSDIFGFSAGSDVADLGAWGGGLEYNGAFGTRFGTLGGHNIKAQVSTSPFPCLEVGPSLNYGFSKMTNRNALTSFNNSAFGGQIEFKYKLLGRSTHGIGLTVTAEPGYSAVESKLSDPLAPLFASEGSRLGSNSFKLLSDFVLIPDRLFGAVNVEYGQTWSSRETLGLNGCASVSTNAWCRGSALNLRAAVSAKINDAFYVGVEAQHLRAYSGTFLNRLNGSANYIGPTFFWQAIPDKLSVSGTFATQVSGHARGVRNDLDLNNFSRHIAKLKLGYSF
ncbi:MAG: hypothetical protein ACRCWF_03420 [Beijerinckiaceae bacterium]